MKDVLIIKIDAAMKQEAISRIHQSVRRQIMDGVVILPSYAHAKIIQCPEDIEVRIESLPDPDIC